MEKMRSSIITLIIVVLLAACGGGESAEPTASQVATTTRAPTAPPTNPPVVEPTEPPTAAPTRIAPATDTPESTATAAPVRVAEGRVSFRDNLAVADQLVLTLRGIAPPPDGSVYEGWLIADDGVTEVSTGVFEVAADGSVDYAWNSPTGENLIARYASFAITVEPADDSDPHPSSQVPFKGAAAPDTLVAARRVFAVNDGDPVTPRNVSYGRGLLTQSQVAKEHILNAFNAAAIGAFSEMRVHGEHVINIIEGTAGPRFADYNGDGRAENPGDGFGTLAYARQIVSLLPGAAGNLSPVESLLIAIQDKSDEILAASDIGSAQPLLNELKAMGEQLLNEMSPTFYRTVQTTVSYPIMPAP
jgi:hypothetical protein